MAFALSTAWNALRHEQGKELIREIQAMGFSEIELSFNLTSQIVKDIEELVRHNQMRVVSLHNFCPIPLGFSKEEALPDCLSLAAFEENQRKKAVTQTKKTIATALRLKAKAVVLHSGRVEVPERTHLLLRLFAKGQKESAEFKTLQQDILAERQRYANPFFENALRSLEELNRFVQNEKIFLGIETRFYCREIPNFTEIGIILKHFAGGNIFYWHDTGHAQVMENLGFAKHKEYLDLYGSQMLGIHLHGVKGCLDHQALTQSEDDLRWIKPYLKKEALKVIEVHPEVSAAEVEKSKEFLENLF